MQAAAELEGHPQEILQEMIQGNEPLQELVGRMDDLSLERQEELKLGL